MTAIKLNVWTGLDVHCQGGAQWYARSIFHKASRIQRFCRRLDPNGDRI